MDHVYGPAMNLSMDCLVCGKKLTIAAMMAHVAGTAQPDPCMGPPPKTATVTWSASSGAAAPPVSAGACTICGAWAGKPCTPECESNTVPDESVAVPDRCEGCGSELVPALDAYYGMDPHGSFHCEPCRRKLQIR